MKKQYLLLLVLLLLFGVESSMAQAPPVFDTQKCLGGTGTDLPKKVIRAHNGGFIIAGSTSSLNFDVSINHGANDFWVIKTDVRGNMIWQKTFGGTGNDIATSVMELSNNDIVVAGYTFSNNGDVSGNHGSSDNWLIRLNSFGTLLWKRSLGGSSNEFCYSMTLANDNGYVLAGSSSSNNGNVSGNHGGKDFWIVKTDQSGNLQWQKSLGGSGIDECYSIKTTADGGYLASGYTTSSDGQVTGNHGNYDYWIVKLDILGNLQWQKCLGGTGNDVAMVAMQNASGNYMIGGYTNSNDGDITNYHGNSDCWLTCLDSANGNLLFQHTYGGSNSENIFDIIATADHGYLLAGGSTSNDADVTGNHGAEDFWLVKTDSAALTVWAKTYGGNSNDRPVSVIQTEDGGFTTIGYSFSNNNDVSGTHGGADIWFLKLSCLTPLSDFVYPSDTVCINATVNFTNASTHAALQRWKIDNVLISNNVSSSFQFNTLGTHKITLCSYTCYAADSISKYITVVGYPLPSISSNQSYLCDGVSARLSTIPADSYLWSNGSTSQDILVNSGGMYSVTVTKYGCSSSTSYSLNQYASPVIDLGNDTSICAGAAITLTIPSGFISYLWQDGSTGTSYSIDSGGWFKVTVSNMFCGTSDSLHVSYISNPVPVITANNSYLCEGQQQTLSTIIADSYLWSTGENTSSIHVDSAGVYFVTVMVNGCSGSTSITLAQHSSPSVNIGNDTTICSVIPLTLHAQPGYLAYSWQDSSTATSLIVNSSGWYSVTVSNVYCSTTDSIHIIAVSCVIPSANFTASQSSVCQHACVNFNNLSLDAVSWNWNFPGATIQSSTDHNPAGICYDTVGVFPVYLVVFSTSGIANTLIRQDYITVNARPAVPTVTTNGTFLTSSFATAYQWMFNSTPVINANNQTYFAAHTGYYSVVITDANGCTAVSDSVYIGITGINNTTNESEWSVYPNPSKGIFNIHFDRHEMNHPQLEVTDITGKVLIHSQPLQSIQGTATIDLQHFSNGVYFLKITDESALTIQKLVIEK